MQWGSANVIGWEPLAMHGEGGHKRRAPTWNDLKMAASNDVRQIGAQMQSSIPDRPILPASTFAFLEYSPARATFFNYIKKLVQLQSCMNHRAMLRIGFEHMVAGLLG